MSYHPGGYPIVKHPDNPPPVIHGGDHSGLPMYSQPGSTPVQPNFTSMAIAGGWSRNADDQIMVMPQTSMPAYPPNTAMQPYAAPPQMYPPMMAQQRYLPQSPTSPPPQTNSSSMYTPATSAPSRPMYVPEVRSMLTAAVVEPSTQAVVRPLYESTKTTIINTQPKKTADGLTTVRRESMIDVSNKNLKSTFLVNAQLEQMVQVTCIDYSNNLIEKIEALALFPHLEKLNLRCNSLRTVEGVSACRFLTHLDVSYNNLLNLTGLESVQSLQMLEVTHNNLKDLYGLGNAPNLRWISVSNNGLKTLSCIEKAPNLQYLDASYNKLTNIQALRACRELMELNLDSNELFSSESVIPVFEALPNLSRVVLTRNPLSTEHRSQIANWFATHRPMCILTIENS